MKKTFATIGAALALGLFATLAQAAQTNTGCQGNCPGGDIVTNAGGTGVGIGYGGEGGNGGNGGSVLGSGNSSNTNANVNQNTQGQQQGQLQGQGQQQGQVATGGSAKQGQDQSQSSSNRNDNRSNASNRNSNAAQGNTTSTSVSVAGDNVTYEAARIPVATAYAAGLTASNGTCMGSTSAGGQGMSFGFSVGTTWKDGSCDRRYNAQALAAVGQSKAAVALLCQDPEIKAAMETAGTPCAATSVAKAAAAQQQAEADAVARSEPLDALVRSRIGLPPLAQR